MIRRFLTFLLLLLLATRATWAQDAPPKPLRALLIAGGCCHDYSNQQKALCEGIQERANVRVDVYWTDNSTTAPVLPLYGKLNWAEGYDVIIHDECAAGIKDPAIVNRIVQTHQKIPAVHLHCAMHSFRTGTDAWFKHLGLQSSAHGPQVPIAIHFVDTKHPITETLSDWTTIPEELYNNVKVLDAHPLAVGKQEIGGDKPRVAEAIVAWTNEAQGARSFSTSLGHNTATVQDPRYLELVTRGLLWACGKLTPAYLKPYDGEHDVTFIDKTKVQAPQASDLGQKPDEATLVKLKASSTQSGHPAHHAIDGDANTRWCANGHSYPQSLQFEFEKPHQLHEIQITWEFVERWYQYRVEGSTDGKTWQTLLDQSNNDRVVSAAESLGEHEPVRFVRIVGLACQNGWCSIREVKLRGEGLKTVWPAADKSKGEFIPLQADANVKRGNTIPRIEKLTPEQEAAILKDVRVPDGFDVTVFASPPAVNYPVFVAAAVDGTLYVSSDGNGSLGRDPQRGRVIRLRDLDGDGRADETKIFCEIDAPRGLVWDHDRLYLMHPPNLSVFIDNDGDGVADEQRTLVKNLAFGYDKRPADHTTNGVSLGVDGWLYIAGGDFGFMDAEGTDGRKVTHRGGGVLRVRPDGTGLEVYSTGTRNILEVAISPQMDMFARDNTNDGGGWDVRLHHFTGAEDHGYPRLYKNFNDECVQPLADYGGGSGCGAVYIDEPGFGKWNNAPFTADWGTGSLYRHTVSPHGATFQETAPPESFIRMTRPTDADVDGNSRVYCASWRGATFKWAGPDVGYIVCVRPKDFQPSPLPDFAAATDAELIQLLQSPSYRRRMEAQRELMRRGNPAFRQLLERGVAARSTERNLLDHLQTAATDMECVAALGHADPVVVHTAIRCLAKRQAMAECFQALDSGDVPARPVLRALARMHDSQVVSKLITRLSTARSQELRNEILAALSRLHFREGTWKGDSWGTRPDTRGPYYQPEAWSQTARIATVLQQYLDNAGAEDASALIETMQRNRIPVNDSLERILQMAASNDKLLAAAIGRLVATSDISDAGTKLLLKTAMRQDVPAAVLTDAVICLARSNAPESAHAMLTALAQLDSAADAERLRDRARNAFINATALDTQVTAFDKVAQSSDSAQGLWADAGLLAIATNSDSSPESRALAVQSIDDAWQLDSRRGRLMQAAAKINNRFLDERILQAGQDPDAKIAAIAKAVIDQMKITPKSLDTSPRIHALPVEEAVTAAVTRTGDIAHGQQIFQRANCAKCHTVRQDELQKGPFLGNIARTYKREELATAILIPSKTIAQGFATNGIQTVDGVQLTGFVTSELSDRVTIRDQQGKEFTIMKEDIEQRQTLPVSVMPTGVLNEYSIHDFASLLDYLQSLVPPEAGAGG